MGLVTIFDVALGGKGNTGETRANISRKNSDVNNNSSIFHYKIG